MSNLIDQASLVMIPSGYKEDKIYSQVPTDGSGDIQFTRASDGTRVNSQGLVERVPWNLFGNSENAAGSNWGNVYNISSITTNSTTAPNGTNTGNLIVENSINSTHWFEQSFSAIAGTPYTISVYFKAKERTQCVLYGFADNGVFASQIVIFNLSTGSVVSQSGTQTNSIESVGNGWYRCSMTLTSGASATGYFAYGLANGGSNSYQGDGTSGLYMWGRQLNTGTLKPYFPTTDRLNVPRLDYSGGCPSLLLEPQRTNLFTYSEQFDQSFWTKSNTTVTPNTTISPDGSQNADTMTTVASTSRIIDTTVYAAGTYTASVYVKRLTGDDNFQFRFVVDGANQTKNFDVTSEWQRFTFTVTATSELRDLQLRSANDGTGTFAIWGAQLEAGSYPTSYIPTTSASVTRVADAASKTGISSLIGGTSGTVFFDIKTNPVLTGANYKQFFYYTDSSASQGYMYLNSGNGIVTNANLGNLSSSITLSPNTRYKIALTYANNDFALYVNGTSVATASSGTPLNFENLLSLGSYDGTSEWNQFVFNQYTHFPSRLTNAELAALTTL